MKDIIQLLHSGDYSCVIENEGDVHTFGQHGVADLYYLLNNNPELLKGASIADKIVGKAAAALMILGGVKKVYAEVISLSALSLLRETGYNVQFGKVVPFIQNRDLSDWCPIEKMCSEENSVEVMSGLIEEFINKAKQRV